MIYYTEIVNSNEIIMRGLFAKVKRQTTQYKTHKGQYYRNNKKHTK